MVEVRRGATEDDVAPLGQPPPARVPAPTQGRQVRPQAIAVPRGQRQPPAQQLLVDILQRRNLPRETAPADRAKFRRDLLLSLPAIALPVLIVVFLRFGIATPTEVAVLAALFSGAVSALLYRDLSLKRLHHAILEAGLATGVVLLVIMASAAIGWLLTFDQMPQHIAHWVQQNVSTQWVVILLMNLMMLFLGMFIDLPAAVLLLTPVFLPLAHSIGMDPIQLGLMMVVNLAIGLYTPPVGTTLFITSALAKVKVGDTVREMWPFYLVALSVLALVSYVPASILR